MKTFLGSLPESFELYLVEELGHGCPILSGKGMRAGFHSNQAEATPDCLLKAKIN